MTAEYHQTPDEKLISDLYRDPSNCTLLRQLLGLVYTLEVLQVGNTAIELIQMHLPACEDEQHQQELRSILNI